MTVTLVRPAISEQVELLRPGWIAAAFADLYPDAVAVPSVLAATVLATEEDWDWIVGHESAVAAVIDQTMHRAHVLTAGQWLVHIYSIAGTDVVVVAGAAAIHQGGGAGQVVVLATAATVQSATSAAEATS